ncbi:unnamed protein product [Ixodes hexagonus]
MGELRWYVSTMAGISSCTSSNTVPTRLSSLTLVQTRVTRTASCLTSSFSASCCLCLRLSSEAFLASNGAADERDSALGAVMLAAPPVAPAPGVGEEALLRRELGIPLSDGRENAAAVEAPATPSEEACGRPGPPTWQLPSSLAPQSQKKEPNLA